MDLRTTLLVAFASLALTACDSSEPGQTTTSPQLYGEFACFRCHSRERLQGVKPADGGGLAGYLRASGGGLTRRPVIVPDGRDHYSLDLLGDQEGRGRHPGMERKLCFACHPIQSDGMGHGARIYPSGSLDTGAGEDCAGACHSWLSSRTTVVGPGGRSWTGSERPADLLNGEKNPHRKIYREGWQRKGTDDRYLVEAVAPGCSGCHLIKDVSHGQKPTCLDCHRWDNHDDSGGMHEKHIGFAGATLPQGMQNACGWCHAFGASAPQVSAGACYNCHLSAHAPRGENGSPQLGP